MNLPIHKSHPGGPSEQLVLNRDVNATRRSYANLQPDEVLITKIFPTIQGEGPYAGQPAVFVRFAGCNLGAKDSCPWCDTYFELAAGKVMQIDQALAQVARCNLGNADLIVLTGGEPLLQPNVRTFILRAIVYGFQVQVETNGYFWDSSLEVIDPPAFTVVVSPKVNARLIYPSLDTGLWQASACLKVLVDADPSSPYHKLPSYTADYAKSGKLVYISPINHYLRPLAPGEIPNAWVDEEDHWAALRTGALFDSRKCQQNHNYAAKLAMEHGYRVSVQSHLLMGLE